VFRVGDHEYAITFRTTSLWTGGLECRLLDGDRTLKAYVTRVRRERESVRSWLLPALIAGAVIGTLAGLFDLSSTAKLLLLALALVVLRRRRGQGEISIEELASAQP
jgi:hypothetical protein